jgi:molecular chaperone GrpE
MSRTKNKDKQPGLPGQAQENGAEEAEFRVEDRRHSVNDETGEDAGESKFEPRKPSLIDEYRLRTEAAEAKLQEYIDEYKTQKREQDEVRARLERDVDRKVDLKFGNLAGELLQTIDVLEISLSHIREVPEAEPLLSGVTMARDGFLATLERHGIEKIAPEGSDFDPTEAEAIRVDPVDDAGRDGKVTETVQPGYRMGDFVIRAARVAVGRFNQG